MQTVRFPTVNGMTCMWTGSEPGEEYRNDYEYVKGVRRALIRVYGDGTPTPSQWRVRQTARAYWFEHDRQVGGVHTYNIVENAMVKTVRFVQNYAKDSEALVNLARQKQMVHDEFTNRLANLLDGVSWDVFQRFAREVGLNVNNMDMEPELTRLAGLLASIREVREYEQLDSQVQDTDHRLSRETKNWPISRLPNHSLYAHTQQLANQRGTLYQHIMKQLEYNGFTTGDQWQHRLIG